MAKFIYMRERVRAAAFFVVENGMHARGRSDLKEKGREKKKG
jgi:hypothetical protein